MDYTLLSQTGYSMASMAFKGIIENFTCTHVSEQVGVAKLLKCKLKLH